MTQYVIRLHDTNDGYRATIREVAPSHPLDIRTLPTGAAGVGAAATAPGAMLAAITSARIPAIPATRQRRPYAC